MGYGTTMHGTVVPNVTGAGTGTRTVLVGLKTVKECDDRQASKKTRRSLITWSFGMAYTMGCL